MLQFIQNIFKPLSKRESARAAQQEYLEVAAILSNGNNLVLENLALFCSNKNAYFKTHQEELLQRGIESPDEISPAIALIDSLNSINRIVYADYKEHAEEVLEQLNSLVLGALAKSDAYDMLVSAIELRGNDAAISNYLEGKEVSYLFNCVTEAKYKLLMIDEDSDAYPLVLVTLEQFETVKKLAVTARIKVKSLEMTGLKL